MTWPQQKQAQAQRRTRRQKHARAFLFPAAGHLPDEVKLVQWEVVLADCGGTIVDAPRPVV